MTPSIKLTYFDIEGAAECVRLALTLAGAEFEDNRIDFSEWASFKSTTPYGQVPVMNIDGGPDRTQSGAMLRWAATLNSDKALYPMDKIYDVEEALGIVGDIQRSWSPCLYIAMKPQ